MRISVFLFAPSSSAATAKRGMMSRLWVLFITSGLALRSDWEELEDARGRRLKEEKNQEICLIKRTSVLCQSFAFPHLPLCPSALLSPLDKCLHPSPGDRIPLPSQRSSFSSLWLRSDDDKLWLDGVEVERCSVLLYTWSTQTKFLIVI